LNLKPKVIFDKDEYIQLKTNELNTILESAGFVKSPSMIEKVDEGDQCLLNLLDQMKREDQDFKVWERDDFSFLRWYVTRQMETLHGKVENLKFVELINEDFNDYVNRMSQDGIPIDKTFIQAVATIFNKDIILIPVDGGGEYDLVEGGLNNGKSKGNPLYLGHIEKTENCPDIFVSVMPETIDKEKVSNILAGDMKIADNHIILNNEVDNKNSESEVFDHSTGNMLENPVENEPQAAMEQPSFNQWTRMDSFSVSGSSSKVDTLINDIINGENLDELFKRADESDSDDEDSFDECDSIATLQEDDQSTPDYSDVLKGKSFSFEHIPTVESTNDANLDITKEDIYDRIENDTASNEEIENNDDDDWVYDEESGYWIAKDKSSVNEENLSNYVPWQKSCLKLSMKIYSMRKMFCFLMKKMKMYRMRKIFCFLMKNFRQRLIKK